MQSFLITLVVVLLGFMASRTAGAAETLYVVGTGNSNVTISGDAGTTNLKSGNTADLSSTNFSYTTLLSKSPESNSNTRMQEAYDSSGTHILGRAYFTTPYSSDAIISKTTQISGTFYLRSRTVNNPASNANDNFVFRVLDYNPTTGAGVGQQIAIKQVATPTSTSGSTAVTVTFPTLGSDYILAQGHYLGLEVQYVSGGASRRGYLYCNSGNKSNFIVPLKFNINATTLDTNGSITPAGDTQVDIYGSQSYTINANPGYQINELRVDGNLVAVATGQSSYTYTNFTNVTAKHTITVSFQQGYGTFNVVPGSGGCISLGPPFNYNCYWPGGSTYTYHNVVGTYNFTVTPNTGYGISQVLVDNVDQGVPLGQTTTWSKDLTLTNNATRNVVATFIPYYTVTASVSGGGGRSTLPQSMCFRGKR